MKSNKLFCLPALALLAAWMLLLRPIFLGGPASYIIISGTSMEPTMYTGDLAVLREQGSYTAGDVVAYRAEGGNVIHRIVGGSAEEGFTMLGDNKTDVDPWKPKPGEILGKMWLYVPGAGRVLAYLRQPFPMAATVGLLTLVAFFPIGGKARRRGMKRAISNSLSGISIAMWVFVGAAVAFATLAGYAFRLPSESSQFVERARYEHTGAFGYSFQGQPSILYPDGNVGPVAPHGTDKVTPPPVYAKLTKTMNLDFSYALKSALPPQLAGEISVLQELKAGENGWTRSDLVVPPAPFSGTSASAHVKVDLAATLALIDAIEKETGATGAAYTLTFTPVVHVAGKVGADAIDDSYSPSFTVKLSKTVITPDSELAKNDVKKVGADEKVPADLSLGAVKLPVQTVRYLGLGLGAICLLAGLLLGFLVYVGWRGNAEAVLKARYGVALIGVKGSGMLDGPQQVEVAGMDDLGRLAQRDGQVIFSMPQEGGERVYFVTKDDVVYSYTFSKKEM